MTHIRSPKGDHAGEARNGVTARIVAVFERAIASGELPAGAKLPPTRQLAELAGVNHLTAARAYRQLAERGLVSSRVGSGTFVRPSGAFQAVRGEEPSAVAAAGGIAWQRYALPDEDESYADGILAEMFSQATRDDVIPLMVGHPTPRLFPLDELTALTDDVMREEGSRVHQYAVIEGVPELREAIAAIPGAQATGDDPGNIIATVGAHQALMVASRAILRPGDAVACESPTFVGLLQAVEATGAAAIPVPCDDDGLDVDALEQLLARREIRMVALQPRLHNPTGRDLSPERRSRLLELARRHGFFVLEDGVYADLRFSGDELPSLRSEAPDHVVYVSSLSKTVSPGLRCGWVAASGPVFDRIAREKGKADMHGPVLPQLVGARFLASGGYERQLRRALELYSAGAEALLPALASELEDTGAEYATPLGGGHVWLDFGPLLGERELYGEALRHDVSFLPGSATTVGRARGATMRVSFGYLPPADLREGARRLGEAVRAVASNRGARQAVPVT